MLRIGGLVTLLCVTLAGCPVDRLHNDLAFNNTSNDKLQTLVNLDYPDSSLGSAVPDGYFEPHDAGYIGPFYHLRKYVAGITVFVFEYTYFERIWKLPGEHPESHLDADSLLAKYYLARAELDSLGWRITYP